MYTALERLDAAIASESKPIILEIHGNNCRPCVTQEDLLAHAAVHPGFPAKVLSINIDDAPDVAARYNIASVPSVIVIDQGKSVARHTGLIDPGSVIAALQTD